MSNTIIKVDNIGKRYQLSHISGRKKEDMFFLSLKNKAVNFFKKQQTQEDFWALQNISFEIEQGDRVGIIGRNGAGKSTLLKILSRIVAPTEGHIEYKGRMASLLEVGTGFHGDLTGRENIYLNGSILGMNKSEINSKFDEIVAFSEVEKFLDTPVKRYSSGMYVRLAFSVAAHMEPDILVVDEVLAVGDAAFQKKCIGKMEEVSQKQGRTILFVSHQMNTLQSLCNKALVLNQGKISMNVSKTEEAIRHYMQLANTVSKRNIEERTDRAGEGKIKVVDLHFFNATQQPVEELICGQETFIHVAYKCVHAFTGNNISVALAFYGDDGVLYTVLGSDYSGKEYNKISGTGTFVCEIKKLPLMEGNYFINVAINQGVVMQDWVQEACTITIIAGDFYGTGKLTAQSHRSILIENSWS